MCLLMQVLEATALDFSRYGDTLFEVLFAGGRLAAGGNVVEEGKKLDTNVSCSSACLRLWEEGLHIYSVPVLLHV